LSYRYGFNGKEKDADGEFGSSTHYDYGFRIYNPSIGKFLSVDPLSNDFPFYTPYQFAGNKPIVAIDLDGLEEKIVINQYDYLDNKLVIINTVTLYRNAEDGVQQLNGYSFDQYDKIDEYGPFGTLTVNHNLNIDNTVEVFEETWKQWYNNLSERSPMQRVASGFGFTVSDDFVLIGQGKETKEAESTTNVNLDVWFENKNLSGSSGVTKVNDKLGKISAKMFWETGNFIPNMTVGAAEGVNRLGAAKTAINSTSKIVTEVKKTITGYNQDSTLTHTIEEGSEALKIDDYNYEN